MKFPKTTVGVRVGVAKVLALPRVLGDVASAKPTPGIGQEAGQRGLPSLARRGGGKPVRVAVVQERLPSGVSTGPTMSPS